MKLANSLDFDKLGAAIPAFILKKIREKFNATKTLLESKMIEGEKRPALILYESDGGKFSGLWVTLDNDGYISRKLMVQDIESLTQVENGSDLFSMLPEIMEASGQQMPAAEGPAQLNEPNLFEDGNNG